MWDAISTAMTELVENAEAAQQLLPAISGLETAFRSADLAGMISEKLVANLKPANHE
jgi:hypothetical protein